MGRTKEQWEGHLDDFSAFGWPSIRMGKPADFLTLNVVLNKDPSRRVEVIVPKELAMQLATWITSHTEGEIHNGG